MAAKIAIGIKTRAAQLRRLSVVFAVEIRLKIVTELYMRSMSPKQFYDEFGGGSVDRVDKHFKKLEKAGWLRFVYSEGPGGKRRGKAEHFYRATELAFFDAETWGLLPLSIRIAFSWNSFKQIAQRMREGMEAWVFEARLHRELSCTPLLLDQVGWKRVIEAVDALFVSVFEEQDDARLRVSRFGGELIRVGVVLIAFESPMPGSERIGACLAETDGEPLIPFPERLAPVFADALCMQIIEALNQRPMTLSEFQREFASDVSRGTIRRRFKRLEKIGWLRRDGKRKGEKRRGPAENIYRATKPPIAQNCPWADVPDALKRTKSWATFEYFSEQVKEAMAAGTFDARTDRYLTWSLLSLDQQGWGKVATGVDALHEFVLKEEERAKERMAKSGEKPVTMTVAFSAFESPKDAVKAP